MTTRFYYIDKNSKTIKHYQEKLPAAPQGFDFAGSSSMKVVSASGFYANNQEGYTIIDGDLPTDPDN